MASYNWTKIPEVGNSGDHRYFKDENTGKIALADDSGSRPNYTEDGVSWFNPEKPLEVGKNNVIVRITREDGSESRTVTSFTQALLLSAHFGCILQLPNGTQVSVTSLPDNFEGVE